MVIATSSCPYGHCQIQISCPHELFLPRRMLFCNDLDSLLVSLFAVNDASSACVLIHSSAALKRPSSSNMNFGWSWLRSVTSSRSSSCKYWSSKDWHVDCPHGGDVNLSTTFFSKLCHCENMSREGLGVLLRIFAAMCLKVFVWSSRGPWTW